MSQLASMKLVKHTVCLWHVDPRCMKGLSRAFFTAPSVLWQSCTRWVNTSWGCLSNNARGFLDPFLAYSLRPQPNTVAACYVIHRRVAFENQWLCGNFDEPKHERPTKRSKILCFVWIYELLFVNALYFDYELEKAEYSRGILCYSFRFALSLICIHFLSVLWRNFTRTEHEGSIRSPVSFKLALFFFEALFFL